MIVEVSAITPGIGAETPGLDISQPMNKKTIARLRELFLRHLVLVFRDQALYREDHKQFAHHFGELHVHPSHRGSLNKIGDPEIFVIDTPADAEQSNGEAWHSDVSCEVIPPMVSLLYVTKVPVNGGGDTMFANMYETYNDLSNDLKTLLTGKTAFHDGEIDLRNYGVQLRAGQKYPQASHPIIARHPEIGRPLLFVNGSFTSHVEGMPRWESDMLLSGCMILSPRMLEFSVG
jgi:taurine dioxygenase